MSSRDHHLAILIRSMLSIDPTDRPVAEHILSDINLCDGMTSAGSISMFGSCCRTVCVSESFHDETAYVLNSGPSREQEERNGRRRLFRAAVKASLVAKVLERQEKE